MQPASESPEDRNWQRLQDELRELRSRVEALEGAVLRAESGSLAPRIAASPVPVPTLPPARTSPDVAAAPQGRPERGNLEARVGSQWLNRVGIIAVLIAGALFLKYAVDQHWLGPAARVGVGLLCGVGLFAWSERFRRREYPVFAFSLKAIGAGLLYLSLWAAYSLFHLVGYPVAFLGMAVVTLGNARVCWVQRSELLAVFAAIGGFLTPFLLGSPVHTPVWELGGYLLLLDAGLLWLMLARNWPRILVAAWMGTAAYVFSLALGSLIPANSGFYWMNAFFLALFSLACTFLPAREGKARQVAASIAACNAATALAALWLLPSGSRFVPALLALWYLGLLVAGVGRAGAPVAAVHAGALAALAALAAWTALDSPAAIAMLALEAALLLGLSLHEQLFGADHTLRSPWPAAGVLAFAAVELMVHSVAGSALAHPATAFWNLRAALYVLLALVAAYMVWVAARHRSLGARQGEVPAHWAATARGAALLATWLLLVGGVLEIHASEGASFFVSAWAAMLGGGLLLVGFRVRWAFLRWLALGLLTLAILKVFLFDTRALSQGYRILSFLGLGVMLLLVSFVYQRDLLKLRGETRR